MLNNKENADLANDEPIFPGPRELEDEHEEESKLSSLSLISKVTHKNLKIRMIGFQLVLSELQKNKQIEDQETRDHILLNPDIMFTENSPESQKLVLQIYKQILELKNSLLENFDLNKKPFWYNFLDKFYCSPKTNIKELSTAFFEFLLTLSDLKILAEIFQEFLAKNNLKLIKVILVIFTNEFKRFEPWEQRLQSMTPIVDRLLLNPNVELKHNIKAFLKRLVMSGYGEVLGNLKNLKPSVIEELASEGSPFATTQAGNSNFKNIDNGQLLDKKEAKLNHQIDLYKQSEPVSIISKFNEVWIENTKSLKKWNEKQEAIEGLLKAAKVPKLQHLDNYTGIISMAKILLDNSHIHVQICAIKIFGAIARGLRLFARQYIKSNFNLLIAKFKDKKAAILEALHFAIKETFYCLTVEEIYDEIKIFNTERNKDIRLNVLVMSKNLLCFLIEAKDMSKNIPTYLKLFAEVFNSYYEDQDIEVRQLNNELVLFILESFEDDPENKNLFKEKIDQKKIKPRAKTGDVRIIQAKPVVLFGEKFSKPEIDTPNLKKIQPEKRKVSSTDNKSNKDLKPYVYKIVEYSEEEIGINVGELLGQNVILKIKSDNWKVKDEGLKELKQSLDSMEPLQMDIKFLKSVFGFLRKEFKDYKESNVICIKMIFECFLVVANKIEFVDDLFFEFVFIFVKKVAEFKFQQQISEFLQVIFRKLPMYKAMHILMLQPDMFGNPKTLSDTFNVFTNLIEKNQQFILNDLRNFLLLGLNNSNQTTRKSVIAFLIKIASSLTNEAVLSIISGVENKNLAKSLEGEVLPLTQANEKTVEESVAAKTKSENLSKKESGGAQSIGTILSNLIKQDWKIRKEAVENYMRFLETNPQCFSVLSVHDTFQNINLRLSDSQKLVALITLTKFKTILGIYFNQLKPYHKLIIDNMLELIIDKNVIS